MSKQAMELDALEDALGGWRYIRSTHGDLYGVGWDRVEEKLTNAIAALKEAIKQQGEPVAWYLPESEFNMATTYAADEEQPAGCLPLYLASAPTIPEGWTQREIELFDGMIEVQEKHAARCEPIQNKVMALKQKSWDLERVALLKKCKSMLSAAPKEGVKS